MAVYTHLTQQLIDDYLQSFALGALVDFEGIQGGVENTNYFVTTCTQDGQYHKYVLTLFEDIGYDELPYFVALTKHLAKHQLAVPTPILNKQGEALQVLNNKPALLLPCFAGAHLARDSITPKLCALVGEKMAQMHMAGISFKQERQAHRGIQWWTELAPRALPTLSASQGNRLCTIVEAYAAMQQTYSDLPMGVIHGDLFHDNVLFDQGKFSAIIDIYNASHDYLLFDVAIAVNDWCIHADGTISHDLYAAFINAYQDIRVFTQSEHECWPTMLQTAAMRFWLSRLETFYGLDKHQREQGVTVLKDPEAFANITQLRFTHTPSLMPTA